MGFLRRLTVTHRGSRLLILSCLFVTIMAFNHAYKFEQLQDQFDFRKLTTSSFSSISLRIGSYAQVLTGAGAHIRTRPDLSLSEFDSYVAGLDLHSNSPGMMAIGFVRPNEVQGVDFDAGDAAEPDASEKKDEAAAPQRTTFPEQLTVTHLAPRTGHGWTIGQDVGFATPKRAAFALARSSGKTVIAHHSPPNRDSSAPAEFLMIKAVFGVPETGRAAQSGTVTFLGWVIAPFGAKTALSGLTGFFGVDYELSVFDASQSGAERKLFSSATDGAACGRFVQTYTSEQYGSTWLMRFESTPAFDAAYTSYLPHMLLVLGLLFTLLVRFALKSMTLRHRALKSLAERRMRQLGAREEENRALIETNVSVVMVLDSDACIVFANEAAAVLFGTPRADFEGCRFEQFVQLRASREGGAISNAEGILASGARLMLDVQTNCWHTADDVLQTTALIRDVTGQINGQREIEAVRHRYDIALTGAGIGIFEIDLVTGAAEMSETWHRITGTDALDVPFDHREHFLGRVHPDDLATLIEADRKCIMGETPRSEAEYRFRFGDQWRWMYSDAVAVAHSEEGFATRLIGTQTDVTALRHARNALELSEARFRMVLEDAPVGMAVMDDAGTFVGVNPALSSLCGYELSALHNKMRLSNILSRRDFVTLSHDMRALHKSDQTKTYQNQFRLRTRGGELRWGLFNICWTFDKNLNENVYIAQIVDITDQKRVEQIKSEFVATVSHELRTPLTSIKGALGLLHVTLDDTVPHSAMRLLDIASTNVDRLTVMVNDILDLERISSGDVAFEPQDVPLYDIVEQTVAEVGTFAAEHLNTLEIAIPRSDVCVHADAGRLRQVMMNLLTNACKFSDPDTNIYVRHEQRDGAVAVLIENIGPPVPDAFRSEIFGAFTQVDGSDTRTIGGTGLGLNIAQQIVMRLGGTIGLEHYPGRRTVFWFTCPLVASTEIAELDNRRVAR